MRRIVKRAVWLGFGVILGLTIPIGQETIPKMEVRKAPSWDMFVEALIQVESGGDPMAIGKTNDVGILQITPIAVKEANRLVGEERYTLDDRFDREKSIEMFNIIQGHYNPNKDFKEACAVWNPRAGEWYYKRVMAKL